MRRFISTIIVSLALVSTASASLFIQAISVPQPAGRWVLCHRPLPIGDFLFGPIWVFIPNPPQAPINALPGATPMPFRSPFQSLPPQNPLIPSPAPLN